MVSRDMVFSSSGRPGDPAGVAIFSRKSSDTSIGLLSLKANIVPLTTDAWLITPFGRVVDVTAPGKSALAEPSGRVNFTQVDPAGAGVPSASRFALLGKNVRSPQISPTRTRAPIPTPNHSHSDLPLADFSCMLAGEGINGRQIIGRTDSNGRDGVDGHCFPKDH